MTAADDDVVVGVFVWVAPKTNRWIQPPSLRLLLLLVVVVAVDVVVATSKATAPCAGLSGGTLLAALWQLFWLVV